MAIDRGALDQQLQDIGEASRWWNQREIRDLPAVLHADETITAISRGRVGRLRFMRRTWLIVVTDDRMIAIRSGRRKGWRQIEITAGQITRVSLRVGPFKGRVLVLADGQTYKLLVPRADAYKVQNALLRLGPTGNDALPGFGPTRIVRSMIDHVMALPAVALAPATPALPPAPAVDNSGTERRLQQLENEVQQLRDQVEFMENLLRKREPFV